MPEEKLTTDRSDDNRPSYLKKRVIIPTLVAIFLIILGIYFVIHSIFYQSTDDAFVEGHITSVAPRVSGPVIEMLIDDNKPVKKGDLLIVIDPVDYQTKLNQVESKLNEAKADLKIVQKEIIRSKAQLKGVKLDIISSKSKLDYSKNEYNRHSLMYKEGISSKDQYEKTKTSYDTNNSNYLVQLEKEKSYKANLEAKINSCEATLARIENLKSQVKEAKLNLEYTKIYAPEDGIITNRSVEVGNYLQIAQPMFSIVKDGIWVVANFKETQIGKMEIGQDVNIKIDTYQGKIFKGKVDSIQKATGARTSLFPPENAVGSYVKIVQRVPVKIIFDEDVSKYNIVPGMSVVPEVKVR